MARIAGVNIPTAKRVVIALTYIHGIGRNSAAKICQDIGIPAERRANDLTDDELVRIRETIDQEFQVEGDLRREVAAACPFAASAPIPMPVPVRARRKPSRARKESSRRN